MEKTRCKHCGSMNTELRKTWTMNPAKSPKTFEVSLIDCGKCGKAFKTVVPKKA